MIPGPEVLLPTAAAVGGVAYLRRRYRDIPDLPSDVPLSNPIPSPEGVFYLGLYQHTPATPARWNWSARRRELIRAAWRPWDGGEQHLEVLGTTNAGKTEAGGLLVATAAGWRGWDVFVGDGMGGEDFTWAKDAEIAVVCKTDASISTMLAEAVREIDRRVKVLGDVRVPRPDSQGVMRAVAPKNVRMLTADQRNELGLRPRLYVLDELPALLMREKARAARVSRARTKEGDTPERRYPILEHLMQFAATARKVGIHIAALAQRNDAEILDGFTGSLFRARVLIGSTDGTAEMMAHGGQASVWKELAAEAGYESDGLERAMRPAGRALVSGLERRPAALVQLFHFDTDSRAPEWSTWTSSRRSDSSREDSPRESASDGPDVSPASPTPAPAPPGPPSPLRPVAHTEGMGATRTLPVGPSAPAPSWPAQPRPRGPLGRFLARLVLALGVWRFVLVPSVTPGARPSGLRERVAEHFDACAACRSSGPWDAAHRRARRLRGSDEMRNMFRLCDPCHDLMTRWENRMIAWRRRPWIIARRAVLGVWSSSGWLARHLPRSAWPYVGLGCFALGLATDRWTIHAATVIAFLVFGIPVLLIWAASKWKGFGPMLVVWSNRSAAEALQRQARAKDRVGGQTLLDAKANAGAAVEFGWANIRTGLVAMSAAYLLGVYGPGLLAGWIA